MAYALESNAYGKTNVRVMRVKKQAERHEVWEMRVECLLVGDFARSYTEGDNRQVIPTDTVKNTVFAMAKESEMNCIEDFALHTGAHFLKMYAHVRGCTLDVEQVRWERIPVAGQPHKWAWTQAKEHRTTCVTTTRSASPGAPHAVKIESGIKDLTVMKTTGSGWVDYHECKYTTLKPAVDRMLSTDVLCTWTFPSHDGVDFDQVYESNRQKLLELFATEYSPGVQATVWRIGTALLDLNSAIDTVYFYLPNKHYWHFDIERFGLENRDEVYAPQTDPSGLIEGRVSRATGRAKL